MTPHPFVLAQLRDAVAVSEAVAASEPVAPTVQLLADHLYTSWFTESTFDTTDSRLDLVAQLDSATNGRGEARVGDGWWFLDGSAGPSIDPPLVRLYWRCPPASAPALVAALARVLELRSLPYTLKCPDEPAGFGRLDAFVLYLRPAVLDACTRQLGDVHTAMRSFLLPGLAPLTLPIAPGVCAAEDPGNGLSYGQSRCIAVADGVLSAWRSGEQQTDAVVSSVLRGFPRHGISAAHPHLGVASPPGRIRPWRRMQPGPAAQMTPPSSPQPK